MIQYTQVLWPTESILKEYLQSYLQTIVSPNYQESSSLASRSSKAHIKNILQMPNPLNVTNIMPSEIVRTLMIDEGTHSIYPQWVLQLLIPVNETLLDMSFRIPPLVPITFRTH